MQSGTSSLASHFPEILLSSYTAFPYAILETKLSEGPHPVDIILELLLPAAPSTREMQCAQKKELRSHTPSSEPFGSLVIQRYALRRRRSVIGSKDLLRPYSSPSAFLCRT